MERFKEYVRTGGQSPAPESATVDSLVAEFPWFTAARVVRANVVGCGDTLLNVLKTNRALSSLSFKPIDTERLAAVTEGEIIDRFLRLGDYRIVADEAADSDAVRTEAELDDEDDIVSEELAEVYAAQGMKEDAIAIYRKLSLLNTEKSVYFAEKIEKLSKNN